MTDLQFLILILILSVYGLLLGMLLEHRLNVRRQQKKKGKGKK